VMVLWIGGLALRIVLDGMWIIPIL
jgi:hypothetical protein